MICTVIQNKTASRVQEILGSVEMAEIRLDRCRLSDEEIATQRDEDAKAIDDFLKKKGHK